MQSQLAPRIIPADLVSGLGTMAAQYANFVAITGGSISNIVDLGVVDGGSGASTALGARTNFGITRSIDTPTLTNVTNITSSSAQDFTTIRIGNDCIVFGRFTITITAGNTNTELGISLKVASNFTLFAQASGGVDTDPTGSEKSFNGKVSADITNDRLQVTFKSPATVGTYTFGIIAGYNGAL